jgi:hypothetical protein
MEPRTLPQRLEDAEHAAADMLKHGAGLERIAPPPIQPEMRRIADSTLSALRFVSDLSTYGRGLEASTRPPADRTVPASPRGSVGGRPIPTFEAASRGHNPSDFQDTRYTTVEDAREHSDLLIATVLQKINDRPLPANFVLSKPIEGLTSMAMGEPDEAHSQADAGRILAISGWLDANYLGPVVSGRFEAAPPILTNESPALFELNNAAEGYSGGGNGLYLPFTNHVMISTAIADPANRTCIIAHETLHYAAFLGGGHDGVRYRDARGEPAVLGHVEWLHEGLTELHAQQLVRSHGTTPTYVGYPSETLTAFYLQQIAGADTVRAAFLSGDFTAVRQSVDARLGEGTFAALAGMESGPGALTYLEGRMDAARVDRSEWDRNPIARIAKITPDA